MEDLNKIVEVEFMHMLTIIQNRKLQIGFWEGGSVINATFRYDQRAEFSLSQHAFEAPYIRFEYHGKLEINDLKLIRTDNIKNVSFLAGKDKGESIICSYMNPEYFGRKRDVSSHYFCGI